MMDAYNIELARRNFTVISVDIAGHGRSSETFGFDTFFEAVMDAYDAVRYTQLNDPDTDEFVYGVLGHSLGAGISLLFYNVSVRPSATIIIGGGMGDQFGGVSIPINETTPSNLMIASGIYDELVSPQLALDTLSIATGVSEPTAEIIYGDFSAGTARKLVFSPTNHLFEMSDARIVTQSVDWMARSLQGPAYAEQSMLNPAQHIYQYVTFFDLLATIAFLLMIFPIILVTYSVLPSHLKPEIAKKQKLSPNSLLVLKHLWSNGAQTAAKLSIWVKNKVQSDDIDLQNAIVRLLEVGLVKVRRRGKSTEEVSPQKQKRLTYSLILGIVTAILFLVLILFGFVFEFTEFVLIPISFGTAFSFISIITGLTVFYLSRRFLGKERVRALTPEISSGRQRLIRELLNSFIVILPSLLWIFGFSVFSRLILDNPIMLTFAADSGAVIVRFIGMIGLAFLMLPLFYADTLWLNATVVINTKWNNLQILFKRLGWALLSRLLGFIIVIAALYVPFLVGAQLGFIMFIALLMLPFAVLLGMTVLNTVIIGGITRNNLAPALLNAILFALVITSMFQLV
jgi:hypothetical protein